MPIFIHFFFNFLKVQNTQFCAKITGMAHVRGGRGNFTEIKFDQIRGRLGTFGDFFAKILRFEGFSRFSLSCRRRYSSALHLIGLVVSSYVDSFRL